MEFADNTFDGVFALEATCHAKDPVIVYKEIFRVLKPGALFVETAWTMLDSYDPQNPEHVKVKNGILVRYCFFPKCTMLLHVAQGRAVAAGPVSPVSTGPLFPSLVACPALPISAFAWRTPTQRPEAHRYHVETLRDGCEQCNRTVPRVFQQLSILTSKRLVSQASPVKGVAFGR